MIFAKAGEGKRRIRRGMVGGDQGPWFAKHRLGAHRRVRGGTLALKRTNKEQTAHR